MPRLTPSASINVLVALAAGSVVRLKLPHRGSARCDLGRVGLGKGSPGPTRMARGPKQASASGPDDAAGRLFVDAASLRVSAATMTVVMVLSPVVAFAQSVPAGVSRIVPDGRTATAVTTNGTVSTVTTGTVSGPNAFNSFSQFQVGRGATGNLVLPQGTSNLINLINGNDPAVINGVVNSYKNGQIGRASCRERV